MPAHLARRRGRHGTGRLLARAGGGRLPEFQETTLERAIALCTWLQPIGVVRATRAIDPLLDRFDIPEGPREVIRANLYQSHACAAILAELRSFRREVHDAEPPSSLGLAALSGRGRRIIATESGHLIQFEHPQLVIDAVTEVVTALR